MTDAWIKDIPRKWKTFVANRVGKNSDNPVDCASRGIAANRLLNHHFGRKDPISCAQSAFWSSLDVTPLYNASTDASAEVNSSAQLSLVIQHQQQDNKILDLISTLSSMYELVGVFAYIKLFTQRLQARLRRMSSNNHSRWQPAIDHSKTYQKTKPKAVSDKAQYGKVRLKSSDNKQNHQHLQHTMKPRDQSFNNFT